MKIGILGSGGVAQALGAGFLKQGHEVMLGTANPAKLDRWAAQHAGARIGSFADAAGFAEVAVLAVKGHAALSVAQTVGSRLAGKTVLDTTNPIAEAAPVDGVLQFFTSPNDSLLERLQRALPQVRFVKAFNSVGAGFMVHPSFAGGPPTMFICGDDAAARTAAAGLVQALGWEVADMGRAVAARAIEPLCMLWCIPGIVRNEWTHAFKLLKA